MYALCRRPRHGRRKPARACIASPRIEKKVRTAAGDERIAGFPPAAAEDGGGPEVMAAAVWPAKRAERILQPDGAEVPMSGVTHG